MTIESCDLPALLAETCAAVRPSAAENGNRIELSCDSRMSEIQADGLRLKQCLLNLLSNAAKFTKDGLIGVTARPDGDDWIEIVVVDTGIGMSPAQAGVVFDAFVQADGSTARKYGGTGLGLSITRRLTQLMGGDVTVASRLGEGSAFTKNCPRTVA